MSNDYVTYKELVAVLEKLWDKIESLSPIAFQVAQNTKEIALIKTEQKENTRKILVAGGAIGAIAWVGSFLATFIPNVL